MGAQINISDQVTPVLEAIHATITDRVAINEVIGAEVVALCKQYVASDAPTRHTTAETLGATPTGFLGSAVDAIHFTAGASAVLTCHAVLARI